MVDPALASQNWYHGLLPREDIKTFLKENGDFLVRMSEPACPGKREFVLSVLWDKEKENSMKHFVIQRTGAQFSIEKTALFNSIIELVNHFMSSHTSISAANNVVLKNPVGRRAWQLDHCDVESTKKLGEGAFGEVHMGKLKQKKTGKVLDVAIKLAKLDNLTKEQIKEIMREARLMRYFDHPNVVRLYGVAAGEEPLMLVMELASNGALDSYLQKVDCPLSKKMEMCLQSCWGLEYLHESTVLHRDIASRNCLYGDGKVKISDFGLSRQGTVYQMNPKCKVPIRWLAVETMKTAMYSQKTDVWSFGIMCWEIFHNGTEPYPGMTVAEVCNGVKEGYRMKLDDIIGLAPEVVTLIETRCWSESPNDRYNMADLSRALERITHIPKLEYSKTLVQEASKTPVTEMSVTPSTFKHGVKKPKKNKRVKASDAQKDAQAPKEKG